MDYCFRGRDGFETFYDAILKRRSNESMENSYILMVCDGYCDSGYGGQ